MLFYRNFYFTAVSGGLAILQNQAVYDIQKFSGNKIIFQCHLWFSQVIPCGVYTCYFLTGFAVFETPLPPSEVVHVFHVDGKLIQV